MDGSSQITSVIGSFTGEKAPDDHSIADLQFPPVASIAIDFCSLSGHRRGI
jgi:hypothetical protein